MSADLSQYSENLSQLSWAERTKDLREDAYWTWDGSKAHRNNPDDADQPYKAPHKMTPAEAQLIVFLGKQKKLLPSRKVPASNRGTHKKQRMRFVQTVGAVAARRAKVRLGMLAVDAAKKSERHTCPPSEPGKRRRRTACARDVAGWLWRTYRVKFCLNTVTADLRVIKKKTM